MQLSDIHKFVINLPEREDRLQEFKQEIKIMTDGLVMITPGIKHLQPFKGIAEAHINCVKTAKEMGYSEILIMEDDIKFTNPSKTREHIDLILNNLPDDWDILLSGVYWSKGLTKVNDYWSLTKEFCGLHWYIVNEKAYDTIINYPGEQPDQNIDRWLAMNDRLKCYASNKMFAIQRPGFSDNVNKNVNYENFLKDKIML